MKITFAMILLMIVAICGCTTDEQAVPEQVTDDVVVGDTTVEEMDDGVVSSDLQVSLDAADVVPTVEEDVEN